MAAGKRDINNSCIYQYFLYDSFKNYARHQLSYLLCVCKTLSDHMYDVLRGYVSTYAQLGDAEFEKLSELLEVRRMPRKFRLVDIGQTEYYLNFMVKGLARKYFLKGREEVITQIAKENDLLSSSVSFLSGKPSMYVVETIEECSFLSITKQSLDKLYSYGPAMERLGRMVTTELFIQKELWEQDQVRYSTRERFVHFVRNNPELLQRVPQKYLASYLNIKPETFSRMKHLLKNPMVEL